MRARFVLPVIGLAVVLAAAVPAPADSFTSLFQDLLAEMNDRDGALPLEGLTKQQKKERAALRKAFRALEVDSKDLAGDLKMAYRMTAALDKAYPVDFVMGDLLDDLNDGLGALVGDGRDELEVAISGLAVGKYRTRAAARLARADATLLLVAEPGTRARQAALRRKCWAYVLAGGRIAARGAPGGPTGDSNMTATVDGSAWQTNSQFGSAIVGLSNVSASTGGVRKVLFTGRRILPHSGGNPDSTADDLPGETTRLQLMLSGTWADVASGTFNIGGSEGVSVSATWSFEDEDGALSQSVALSGSVTIATMEVTLGSVSVTGTFDFTMYDGGTETTFPVAAGTFEALDLPRSEVP